MIRFHLRCFKFNSMPNVAENGGQICDREIRFWVGPGSRLYFLTFVVRITILDQRDVVLERDNYLSFLSILFLSGFNTLGCTCLASVLLSSRYSWLSGVHVRRHHLITISWLPWIVLRISWVFWSEQMILPPISIVKLGMLLGLLFHLLHLLQWVVNNAHLIF